MTGIFGLRIFEICATEHAAFARAVAIACATAAVATLAGCVSRGGDIPYDPVSFAAPKLETRGALSEDLPLGPLDSVKINVFRVPDLSGDYLVGSDGALNLPLVGRVDVRNLTASQAAVLLEQRYSARYLNNPHITVSLLKSNQSNVVIEGGVRQPGTYAVGGSTTLVEAVASARGIDPENGNARRVAIFRKIDGQRMAAAFDLVDIRRGKMENPAVYPGDIVVVESNSLRSIYREVLSTLPILAIFKPF